MHRNISEELLASISRLAEYVWLSQQYVAFTIQTTVLFIACGNRKSNIW
jgi:hypothetical protein